MNLWKKYLILMLACAGVGIIVGSLFRGSYFDAMEQIVKSFGNYVTNQVLYMGSREKLFLLAKIVMKRILPFALLWLLTTTPACRLFIIWLCGLNGFVAGFWCCFLAMAYGYGSVKLVIAWYFPQIIFYGFAYVVSVLYIIGGYKNRKYILITLLILVLLTGCVLETYVNPLCLRWAFS